MADKTVRKFIENYLKFYKRKYNLSFWIILFKEEGLNTYACSGSTVVEHSTADPEIEGLNPAANWR
jgi:hypothetical protein